MITILHIFVDDKFPKGVYGRYQKEGSTNNICAIFKKNECLKFVGDIEGLNVLSGRRQIRNFLKETNYDAVFFHSLPVESWPYVQYVPEDKIVIWWAWGYDLYDLPYGLKPFIKVGLFKPLTRKVLDSNYMHRVNLLIHSYKYLYYAIIRQKIIKRINYFQPVTSIEYKLMFRNKGFNAKEYYDSSSFQSSDCELIKRKDKGDVLFCNSAHPTNNHLDVANTMNRIDLDNRDVFIPVSYGSDSYKGVLKSKLKIKGANLVFLECLLPKDEYYNMISKCSYFVSGVMRQQSMGNISYCLLNGIKIFLYKDSLPYQYLKEGGYNVYAIEEINENSFNTALSLNEAKLNRELMEKEAERRKQVWSDFLKTNKSY